VVSSLDLDIGEETDKVTSSRNGYQLPSFATGLACEGDTPSTACAPIALADCVWSKQSDHIITNTCCWLSPSPAEHDVHFQHACIAGSNFVLERKDT
jgi:hypothetical protein